MLRFKMLKVYRKPAQCLIFLLFYTSVVHCIKTPQASDTSGLTTVGTSLSTAIREQYRTCSVTPLSGARACKVQALNGALNQAGLRAPGQTNADTRTMVNDLNRRRFAVTQACKEPGGLNTTFPSECQALTGGGNLRGLIDVLKMIGGFTNQVGTGFAGTKTFFEYLFVEALAVAVYDKSGKPWNGQINATEVPLDPKSLLPCHVLTTDEKTTLEHKYGGGERFPMQLMSLDYVAKHAFESMKYVEPKYRKQDCSIRSVGVGVCADPQTLYKDARRRADLGKGPGFAFEELNYNINSILSVQDTSYSWPYINEEHVRDWSSTKASGVATLLVERGGIGTYIAAVKFNKSDGGRGHVVVVSVHRDGAGGYRIYSHDFQLFVQHEGLPQLPPVPGHDPRTDVGYKFIKVSETPLPVDPEARGLVGGAIKAIQDVWFKFDGPSPDS